MEPNAIVGTDEEDSDYVPSNNEESEDETMDTEVDADIWLQDIEHPSSSRRLKGRRWYIFV